jgi:hypothetical protein
MGKSAPKAPDPAQTAAAQGAANLDTAIAQGYLNMVDQNSPFGSVKYNQIGTQEVGGKEVPRFEQTTTLDPSQQRQLDATNQLSENALGVGNTMFNNVAQATSQPFNPTGLPDMTTDFSADRQKTIDDIYNTQTTRLDDRFGRDQASLESRLANQGIAQGSEAYTAAMKDFGYGKNDAYNQAMGTALAQGTNTQQALNSMRLGNRQQGYDEQSYERSLPMNELASLLGFSGGVQAPQFNATPQTGISPTDVAGPINDAYKARSDQYQSNLSGMYGAGQTALTAAMMFSDIRLKDDVVQVGFLNNGLPVYLFRYKGEDKFQIGLMAQDVEKTHPHAVKEVDGFKAVNYVEAVQ